jgi:hypothetical protein
MRFTTKISKSILCYSFNFRSHLQRQIIKTKFSFNNNRFTARRFFARATESARFGDITSAEIELKIIKSYHKELLEINSAEATYKGGKYILKLKQQKHSSIPQKETMLTHLH